MLDASDRRRLVCAALVCLVALGGVAALTTTVGATPAVQDGTDESTEEPAPRTWVESVDGPDYASVGGSYEVDVTVGYDRAANSSSTGVPVQSDYGSCSELDVALPDSSGTTSVVTECTAPADHAGNVTDVTPSTSDDSYSHSVYLSSEGGAIEWTSHPAPAHGTSVTVAHGTVYFGTGAGALVAVDAETGTERWQVPLDGSVEAVPTVANATVYATTANGTLHAVDASTGRTRWTRGPDLVTDASPTVTDGTLYVTTRADEVLALGLETATERWRTGVEAETLTAPVVADGSAYVGAESGDLVALNATSGERRWRRSSPDAALEAPTVANGTVFTAASDANVSAHSAADGALLWREDLVYPATAPPTVADGTVYATYLDAVHALDAGTGEFVDRTGTRGDVLAPAVADGVLFFGAPQGRFVSVDGDSFSQRWFRLPDLGGWTSPTVANGTAYVATASSLYAFDAGVEGSSEDSLAELGTSGHVGDRGDPGRARCGLASLDGTGTADDPFEIASAAALRCLEVAPDAHFALVDDVDATETAAWNDGAGFTPIERFGGVLDGQGHEVEGLTIDADGGPVGPIAELEGTVRDLSLSDVSVTGTNTTGGLYGVANDATVEDVTVTGSITATGGAHTGDAVGALGGVHSSGTITDVRTNASVTGTRHDAGGTVGRLTDGATIQQEQVEVGHRVHSRADAGGLVGRIENGSVTAETVGVWANVTSEILAAGGVAGVANNASLEVGSLRSPSTISGAAQSGGLAGRTVHTQLEVSDVEVDGTLHSDGGAGGVVGRQRYGASTVHDLAFRGTIGYDGFDRAGAVGAVDGGNVTIGTASVRITDTGGSTVAGLVASATAYDGRQSEVVVENASVSIANLKPLSAAAGLVGRLDGTRLDAGTVATNVSLPPANRGGGIVGMSTEGEIDVEDAQVSAHGESGEFGGIVGLQMGTSTSVESLEATVTGDGVPFFGGLAGHQWDGELDVDELTLDATLRNGSFVGGGLYGVATSTDARVDQARVSTSIAGAPKAGGLAGAYDGGTLEAGQIALDARVRRSDPDATDPDPDEEAVGGLFGIANVTTSIDDLRGLESADASSLDVAADGTPTDGPPRVDVRGPANAGGVAGVCQADVRNASVAGTVTATGDSVGGLCGRLVDATVADSSANVTVEGQSRVGGIAGELHGGELRTSTASGSVTGEDSVGGVVGNVSSGRVTDVRSDAAVTGSAAVGGVAGIVFGEDATVQRALATGAVDGDQFVGGGAGRVEYGTVEDVHWDRNATGQSDSTSGTAHETDALTGADATATLESFAFPSVWRATASYPDLAWRTGSTAAVGDTVVRDTNGDGHYRDVTGDGSVTNSDVVAFFSNQHAPAWNERTDLFDFDGDENVGQSDVIALFEYVVGN